jgi:hypothetical protein
MGWRATGGDAAGTEEGEAMNLLATAGEVVLWCLAGVIGLAVVAVGVLWGWDKYSGWKWERRAKR